MPMFYVPKPRQFNYKPRYYDPRKERLEELKRKYADNPAGASEEDMEYFQQRVRELDEEDRRKKLTWKDMFRKRKMPKFEYKPRFAQEDGITTEKVATDPESHVEMFKENTTRIKRSFDYHKSFERQQRHMWVIIVVVVILGYILYRYHDSIISSIYNFFF